MKNIYIITNLINKKQYVGKTKQLIEDRFNQHVYLNTNTIIHYAILEYGKVNFKVELLETVNDDIALQKEKFYINKFNTLYPNGYNEILGQSLKGGNNRMKGKHLPLQWRQNLARPGIQNGRACKWRIIWLDTLEVIDINLMSGVADWLYVTKGYIKKWKNKIHTDYRLNRPIVFYNLGRYKDGDI